MTLDGPGTRSRATLTSLAAELGLHVSTVSRALSGDPGRVSATTVESVRRLAEQRGYRSNLTARALRTGRSSVVGMLVPRLTDEVLATVYEGVDLASMEADYVTLVANTLDDADLREQRVDLLLGRQVDGVILADSLLGSNAADRLDKAGVPYVLALRCLPTGLNVGTDDLLGGRLAAEHLLSLGHRRIGVIAGEDRASTGVERARGFLDACAEAGIAIPEHAVVPCRFSVTEGARAAAVLLDAAPDVTAIFAASDNVALGAVGTLRERGLSVPDDVSLVGYNNLPMAASMPVPLTSVDSRLVEVGRGAMAALLDLLDGGRPSSLRLAPELVVRASTAPPRA
ncbi:LacI family DNA-binding transcriptional regulator [Ornithinimicrobium tianjinense]|uniref:LacI family transcriptional regulator n=1 Tax=Ornithinimicrobium tianjinense TaxID=1195761 RepID=A0A917BH98_9MICO|nr:LacI family DNA-binding transcriptional regulator [Ornithinimicrobium tianjinense]GGF41024.1 LacI family transcriptional regulator [Ornithinimicrobium tianjinense]